MDVKKLIIKEIKSKGGLRHTKTNQYLRVAYLPETKIEDRVLSSKFSIEVGKIIEDGSYSKPTSFRSHSKTLCLMIIEALMKAYLLVGGSKKDIRILLDNLRLEDHLIPYLRQVRSTKI